MKDELTLKDFYRFIKDNIKILYVSMVLLLIATIGYVVFSHFTIDETTVPGESPIELTSPPLSDERYEEMAEWPIALFSEPQIRQMQAYLLPRAYRLTIYTEHEDYEPIANTTFMREVFRNKEVLDYIEDELGEDLTPAIDFAVHIENLANSGVYELHFQRGTREESLELAYIVRDAIEEGVIPVLNNKTVYFITEEPEIIVADYSEYFDETNQTSGISLRAIVRDGIIYSLTAIIIGSIVGLLIALLASVLNKKVTALYDYVRDESDKIVRLNQLKKIDSEEKLEKGIKNITLPHSHKKVLLYEESITEDIEPIVSQLHSNIYTFTDFSLVDTGMEEIKEIIILSLVNKTSKTWYNNQRVQLNGYNIPIKIIQI